ncbi:MAG: hypothetical protein JXP34_21135 [Planctomycetes bacterium]|nr:hypothetical protein [Planctomycetota bacterium]
MIELNRVMVVACALLALAGGARALDLEDDFTEFDDGVWALAGVAEHDPDFESVVLTPLTLADPTYQGGGLFLLDPISTRNLEVTFTAEIGGGTGADGLAVFVIAGDAPPALGAVGGGLGMSDLPGPIVHVELDTYGGGGDDFEAGGVDGNHIGVGFTAIGGDGNSPNTQRDATIRLIDDISNTGPVTVNVWLVDGHVTVAIQNDIWMPDLTTIIDAELDGWEGDFDGILGFTGATGGSTDRHEIHYVKVGTLSPCARVERSFSVDRYDPGTALQVTLDLADVCGGPGDPCTPPNAPDTVKIIETLPAGWTASNPTAPGVVGPADVITWEFTGGSFSERSLTYTAMPVEGRKVCFSGALECSGFSRILEFSDYLSRELVLCEPLEDEFVELDDIVWLTLGEAIHDAGAESVVLTPLTLPDPTYKAGGLVRLDPCVLGDGKAEIEFVAEIGGGDHADGMVMFFIGGDEPPAALGNVGSGLGIVNLPGPIFHVELDTYGGTDDWPSDPAGTGANHVGVGFSPLGHISGSDVSPNTQVDLTVNPGFELRDAGPIRFLVEFEDGHVIVSVQNDIHMPDLTPIIEGDLDNWDGAFEGYLGFAGGTGGLIDRHELHYARWGQVVCPTQLRLCGENGTDVRISWKNPETPPTSVGIARDGTLIAAAAAVDPPTYLDSNPGLGRHVYELTFAGPGPACDPLIGEIEFLRQDDVAPWTSMDIGTCRPGGIEKTDDDAFDIHGIGGDIAGSGDVFRFTYLEWEGDFDIAVRVDALDDSDPAAKAGLMARASMDRNAPMACIFTTPETGTGVDMTWRDTAGAAAGTQGPAGVAGFPVYLRLVRIGLNFSGMYSTDGVNWTEHVSHPIAALDQKILVGMAVASRMSREFTTAEFRDVAIECVNVCPSGVEAVCTGTDVALTWSNNYEYARIRIYRVDATGASRRIASLPGDNETFTDKTAAGLPAGTMQYQIVPVVGIGEVGSCQACPNPECAAGEGSLVCIDWPACTKASCGCSSGGEPLFIRGDTDGNGLMTIGDGVQILERLFVDRAAFGSNCEKTGDFDDSGALEIGDAVSVFNLLFVPGSRLPKPPYPDCGADPTDDPLPCPETVAACR